MQSPWSLAFPPRSDDPNATVDGDASGVSAHAYATPSDQPTLLPLSPAFVAFIQTPAPGVQTAPALAAGGRTLGYVPSPLHVAPASSGGIQAQAIQTFPATYDLRTTGKLGPVRDQGNCGSCWAFGTYAAAESQLLPSERDDFSEEHLNDWHGFDIAPCNGGNLPMSIAYMSRWAGPVAETDAPYTASASRTINKTKPAAKHLQSALYIPDRTGSLDNAGIKSAVMTYGAVATAMRWDSTAWSASTNSYYNGVAGSYSNHIVAIVGWDDNYAASKFAKAPARATRAHPATADTRRSRPARSAERPTERATRPRCATGRPRPVRRTASSPRGPSAGMPLACAPGARPPVLPTRCSPTPPCAIPR